MGAQVRWQGTDAEGLPILVIKASKACAECQGSSAEAVGEAIIGQVQHFLLNAACSGLNADSKRRV